jgi:hypothetical protein
MGGVACITFSLLLHPGWGPPQHGVGEWGILVQVLGPVCVDAFKAGCQGRRLCLRGLYIGLVLKAAWMQFERVWPAPRNWIFWLWPISLGRLQAAAALLVVRYRAVPLLNQLDISA